MSGSGLKKLWQEVREASGLVWFRPYDTRHTAATRLAEAGVPVDIIVARMGHCGERMREHYAHIGLAAQRRSGASRRRAPATLVAISIHFHLCVKISS